VSEHSRDDELLKAFLSGDSELSRRYREAGTDEPPAHVDAAIIASARWAVGADRAGSKRTGVERNRSDQNRSDQNRSDQNSSDQADTDEQRVEAVARAARADHADKAIGNRRDAIVRWRIPLATAAVVVIAATLTLMIERSPETDHDRSGNDIALLDDLGRGGSERTEQSPPATSEQRPQETGQASETVTAKPVAPAKTQPAKTEAAKTEAAKRQVRSQQTAKQAATTQPKPKPVPPVSSAPAASASNSPAAPPQSIATTKQPGKRAEAERVATLQEEQASAEPESAMPTGSATAQKSVSSSDAQADSESVAGRETDAPVANYAGAAFPSDGNLGSSSGARLDQPSTLADMSTPREEANQTTSVQPPEERESTLAGTSDESLQPGSADARDPQRWIKDINELLAQGKRAQAIDSLKAFRRKYPDYQLTPELRALLPSDGQ